MYTSKWYSSSVYRTWVYIEEELSLNEFLKIYNYKVKISFRENIPNDFLDQTSDMNLKILKYIVTDYWRKFGMKCIDLKNLDWCCDIEFLLEYVLVKEFRNDNDVTISLFR